MSEPYIIGICGGSGSGKTTFIRKLRERFTEEEVCIVSQDDYYKPREEQHHDEQGIPNYDLPKSIDKKMFLADLERLASGQTIQKKEYVFNNDRAEAKTLTIKPAPVIIVEGLFVFHYKKLSQRYKLKVFINAKENLKVIRRILRDQIERNYPLDDVLYRYEHHVLPSYEKYIEPYRETADMVINNNLHFDESLDVFEGFLREKLRNLRENDATA
ncbi:MAG: uridine kinase [Saprospiraceae bacterium]|nr:uridine kinase [Saprospiraceae bacterium]